MSGGASFAESFWGVRTEWRLRLLYLLIAVAGLLYLARHLQLIVQPPDYIAQKLIKAEKSIADKPGLRMALLDREGYPLAISLPSATLAIYLPNFKDSPVNRRRLSEAAGISEEALQMRFSQARNRQFIFVKRQLLAEEAKRVRDLQLDGVRLVEESKRYYPVGEILAPVTGLVDIDGHGIEGLEAVFEPWLQPGEADWPQLFRQDIVDADPVETSVLRLDKGSRDIQLTLDINTQYLAYRSLKETVISSGARAGSLVAVDVPTGDILAIVNYPSYNPNDRSRLRVQRNRAAMDRIEPGSTIKPFTVAAALNSGHWNSSSEIDTSPGYLTLSDGNRFADSRNLGVLALQDVLVRSSQVGTARLALSLDSEAMLSMLRRLGFGNITGVGLHSESEGYVPLKPSLSEVERVTMGFGYGFSVTLLQLVQAYAMLGNDGVMQPLRLIRGLSAPEPRRVLDSQVANEIVSMLEQVVQQGTGRRARLKHYRVAGKTGTVHIVKDGIYQADRYRALFTGLAPVSQPRLAVAVMIEEPGPNEYFGGQIAAPVFSRVVQQMLVHMGVSPDRQVVY